MSKLLTAVTLIRNGEKLKYPYKECIRNMSTFCDEVLVNYGESEDNTLEKLTKLAKELSNVTLVTREWNMSNTGDGSELAKQANELLPFVQSDWVIYVQADEMLRPDDGLLLRKVLDDALSHVNQVELYRTYFWGSLEQRATEHEIWLGRIFRKGTHMVGGDGMFLVSQVQQHVVRFHSLLFHYSRMGEEEDVNTRWRNLDLFFHERKEVAQFDKFKYDTKCRQDLIQYQGIHPEGIKEFYNVG